jgi:lysophospholipase L1-like esterase
LISDGVDMNRRRCWLIALLASLGLLIGPLPAYATPPTLVAIGDSFAAGVGSFVYYNDGTDCYRSPFSYPSQLAAATRLPLTLLACSGATTDDVLNEQVQLIPKGADLVTVTVGGNNIGYRPVLTTCGLPGFLGNCDAAIDAALVALKALPDRLAEVYAAVKAKAPGARVVVTGYPRLFNERTDCNPFTFFTTDEMARLNIATDRLNVAIQSAAEDAGLAFVAVAPAFIGHAVCDQRPWINGLTFPVVNSYHPNIAGHTAYAVLVGRALFGSPVALQDASRLDAAAASLPAVTSAQRSARIPILDLNSPEVARAAARAGVTKAELRRLRAAQRDGASNTELDRLDAKITAAAAKRRAAR